MQTLFGLFWISGLQVRGSFPEWLACLLAALAIVAVVVLYLKEAGRLGLPARIALATVRAGIVAVVAFLLLRPVWVKEEKGDNPRPIAVLIDVSLSMASEDPRPNTADRARAAIAQGLIDPDKGLPDESFLTALGDKLKERPKRIEVARSILTNAKINFFPRLAKLGPLQVFTFGSQRTGRDPTNDDWLKNLAADEPRTALVEAAF